MIHYCHGNLLQSDAEALVNTVNCVGVMGKGIALQFKQAFPDNFTHYEKACKANAVKTGSMLVVPTGNLFNPRWIINFPTKTHWRAASRLAHIEQGLVDLVRVIREHDIRSIAVPPLGCGNGGLSWQQVKPLIEASFRDFPDLEVFIFPPQQAPAVDAMPIATAKPQLTRARALFIKLIEQYCLPGYRLSLLEIQKLSYFLQAAGEPLRLNFKAHHYGPYADNLNHVLQRLEGHFIRGYGDRSKDAEIHLLPNAIEAADDFLNDDAEAMQRLTRIKTLIEGFETPYGMELLATVHWILQQHPTADEAEVIKQVHHWNPRKKALMRDTHIIKALARLRQLGWDELSRPSALAS
ncbi:MAG: macro domain-containing protein [Methylovulum miyakonense]|uniref:type II toxin-antitoxin system antitoxin DNA ADP-ribosyl glycohydrolase DarG n=1 Tax=Methylovulum miyakonense TaxID=645578 RepID=UPI003BB6F77E